MIRMKKYTFQAVVFDLDGVITQTAQVHFQSWKEAFDEYMRLREKRDNEPFKEFTHEADYLPYVDGKPRYKGVQSFLESRNIHIPFGEPSDGPDKETVCGIGNKKNAHFTSIISTQGAEIYPSSVKLIEELIKAGIKVGVASSSKNCQQILKACKIEHLFQTRVDGVVSAEIGLKGKPEADIFVVAAHNLGASVAKAVVVEDASSGVEAGRNGGFGLVLGIARKNNTSELLVNGADVVVDDLDKMTLEWIEDWFHKKPLSLSEYWEKEPDSLDTPEKISKASKERALSPGYTRSAKKAFFSGKKLVFFLDYDGTLTPIVSRPEFAVLSDEMRGLFQRVATKHTVAIVSGRARQDVEKLVGLKGVCYAGSHGFDIAGPNVTMIEPRAEKTIPLITEIMQGLKESLKDIEGLLIEEKKFSVAVHYRLVDEGKYLAKIEEVVKRVVDKEDALRLMKGKKVFEILPAIDWDKGQAIRWIMEALNLSWDENQIVYIGDDTTDEDAFRTVRTRGVTVLVADKAKESAADFIVSNPDEVKKLFEKLL